MNNVIITGRLTRDPELRYVNDTAVVNFTLAVDRNYSAEEKEKYKEEGKQTADFIRVTVWGKARCEAMMKYLQKGLNTLVQGRIQTGSYDAQDGSKRYTFEVVANTIEFLEWPEQTNQQGAQQGAQQQAPQAPQAPQGQQNYQPQPQQPQQNYGGYTTPNQNEIPF